MNIRITLIVTAFIVILPGNIAHAEGTFDSSVSQFNIAVDKYESTLRSRANDARTETRAVLIKQELFEYLRHEPLNSAPSLSFENFLCGPRADDAELQAYLSFLTDVGGSLGELTQQSPHRLIPLLYALGKDYGAPLGNAASEVKADKLSALKEEVANSCRTDINGYYENVYGPFAPAEEKRIFGDILGIIAIFKRTIVPAVKGVLSEIDQRRRNKAIRDFIRDEESSKLLTESIARLDKFMEQQLVRESAAAMLEAKNAFHDFLESAVPASQIPECRNFLAVARLKMEDEKLIRLPAYEECYAALSDAWRGGARAAAAAAAKYDYAADAQIAFSSADLQKSLDYMQKVAEGKLPTEAEGQAFLDGILGIIYLGDQIEVATSEQTGDEIADALDRVFGSE